MLYEYNAPYREARHFHCRSPLMARFASRRHFTIGDAALMRFGGVAAFLFRLDSFSGASPLSASRQPSRSPRAAAAAMPSHSAAYLIASRIYVIIIIAASLTHTTFFASADYASMGDKPFRRRFHVLKYFGRRYRFISQYSDFDAYLFIAGARALLPASRPRRPGWRRCLDILLPAFPAVSFPSTSRRGDGPIGLLL